MHSLTDSSYIPFVQSKSDRDIVTKVMAQVELVRMSAQRSLSIETPQSWRLWLDPSFDGYADIQKGGWSKKRAKGWEKWIRQFPQYNAPLDSKLNRSHIEELACSVLSSIAIQNPTAISVPQMSYAASADSHKVNKMLARVAGHWKKANWANGTFVLPVVITDYEVFRTQSKWDSKLKVIDQALEESRASVVWIVFAGFDDLSGVSSREKKEFPKLIERHSQLRESLPANTTLIAGPYWAINLILWAQGIVDYPAISCGSGYRYYPPSSFQPQPKTKIALPSLRRWCRAEPSLKNWLKKAQENFPIGTPIREEFKRLESHFASFLGTRGLGPSKYQTAVFYESWLQEIASLDKASRALFLYQDFSSAFVTGSQVKIPLPSEGGLSAEARRPGAIAQQFMLQCLPR